MILLKINKIKKILPVKWEEKSSSEMEGGQTFVYFAGDHPDNPEFGIVEISIKVLNGSFENIKEIYFITDDVHVGELVYWEKGIFGNYKIAVKLNSIYKHGLAYSSEHFILRGGAIIGITNNDKKDLKDFDKQKKLLSILIQTIIPSKYESLLNLAMPSFVLVANEKNEVSKSYFLGSSPHKYFTDNDLPLMHLATIHMADVSNMIKRKDIDTSLSFFIKTQDTEERWPEKNDEAKVISYNSKNESFEENVNTTEEQINFDVVNYLDIPSYNDSHVKNLNFSEKEEIQYEALISIYKKLILKDKSYGDINKFLGYPDNIQDCVLFEAERIKNNRNYGDEIFVEARDWQLLLQVSPYSKWFKFFDDFGDGTIYFVIRKGDLKNRMFDDIQIIVQST